jgi:LPXTG-site transpeptidase (sortase) family protein
MKSGFLQRVRSDRRTQFGAIISGVSLLFIGISLFAVVSALTDNPVQLPHEGSIQDFLGGNSGNTFKAYVGGQQPTPTPSGPRPKHITITRIGVDAPVIDLNFEPGTNTPAVPDSGSDVGWYDFSGHVGADNAVFAGHVDWQTANGQPIPGAFYRLRELRIGDEITVDMDDGSQMKYRVTGNVALKWDDPNVGKAMNLDGKDVLTLITCGGQWEKNPSEEHGGNYTHRIIVRAERAAEAPPAAAAIAN